MNRERMVRITRALIQSRESIEALKVSGNYLRDFERLRNRILRLHGNIEDVFLELVSESGIEVIGVFRAVCNQDASGGIKQVDPIVRVATKSTARRMANAGGVSSPAGRVHDSQRRTVADSGGIYAAARQKVPRF